MICEQCEKENKKSKIYENGIISTCLYCLTFYDEDGKLHHHDSNIITMGYRCSNNHEWQVKNSGSCWCGWGNN